MAELSRVSDVVRVLEAWAPAATAQSYDNVGLQVGDPSAEVRRGLIALDVTPAVLDEAREIGAGLIVSHHPLIFRPLHSVTPTSFVSGLAFRLTRENVALVSAHTNLDAARDGVSFALASRLGLEGVQFLQRAASSLYKLVTFVPESHLEAVREALAGAGAGRIGEYDACAFTTPGTGYFRAGAAAHPFIGQAGGGLESAQEVRIEVEVSRWALDRVRTALRQAHPYEEVAYDVYPVEQLHTQVGMGAIGTLKTAEPLAAFLARVEQALGAHAIRFTGDLDAVVHRVAVCGGAGSDLISHALRAGADAYVTADLTYHRFFDVLDLNGRPRMALIDAGHYETEAVTEQLLQDYLARALPEVDWRITSRRTSPVQSLSGPRIP